MGRLEAVTGGRCGSGRLKTNGVSPESEHRNSNVIMNDFQKHILKSPPGGSVRGMLPAVYLRAMQYHYTF